MRDSQQDLQYKVSGHLFSHRTHPWTKIVRHLDGTIEYCCPYNDFTDSLGNPVGVNDHYNGARKFAEKAKFNK